MCNGGKSYMVEIDSGAFLRNRRYVKAACSRINLEVETGEGEGPQGGSDEHAGKGWEEEEAKHVRLKLPAKKKEMKMVENWSENHLALQDYFIHFLSRCEWVHWNIYL